MDLSYEETMRRIEEYEKADIFGRKLPREKKMPYYVDVYCGEGQILIVPFIDSVNGLTTAMAKFWRLEEENAHCIGEIVREAIQYIHDSPIDIRTKAEKEADAIFRNATNCKSYAAFGKKYMLCIVCYREDGSYVVTPSFQLKRDTLYDSFESSVNIACTASSSDLGNAIIQGFAEMEAFEKMIKKQKPARPRTTIETLSGSKLSFEAPEGGHYVDEEDYGAAEVYQGYSYRKESEEESVADMYFSIAAELDCDLSPENVSQVYKKLYGADVLIDRKDVDHPVFEKCIEVTSTQIHHVVYVRQVDEAELLACELVVKRKPAGKRIYNKVLKDFESLLASVAISQE